ncbi:hypothetical protein FRB99_004782, partial [Tulasnella sp. 403]
MAQASCHMEMITLKQFLTGKAGTHYMENAVRNLNKYTLKKYLRELFNHCFPPDILEIMHDKFDTRTQRN